MLMMLMFLMFRIETRRGQVSDSEADTLSDDYPRICCLSLYTHHPVSTHHIP